MLNKTWKNSKYLMFSLDQVKNLDKKNGYSFGILVKFTKRDINENEVNLLFLIFMFQLQLINYNWHIECLTYFAMGLYIVFGTRLQPFFLLPWLTTTKSNFISLKRKSDCYKSIVWEGDSNQEQHSSKEGLLKNSFTCTFAYL